MTGLFLLLIVGLWVVFVSWLVPRMVKSIQLKPLKSSLSKVLFLFLLLAPLADEIIGGIQFHYLCRYDSSFNVNEEKIKSKKVKLELTDNGIYSKSVISIREFLWNYIDIESGQTLMAYKMYRAHGGILIRSLGISENNSPLIFNSECIPEESKNIFDRLNISVVYK